MKRVIFLIILVLYVSHIMYAQKKEFGNGLYWELNSGVLTISGNGAMTNTQYPWEYTYRIEKIIIKDGITSVGDRAFQGNYPNSGSYYLKSVEIGNTVTSIGRYAFVGCAKLQSVKLGSSLTSIGEFAFSDCTSLQSVNIPQNCSIIGEGAFYGCRSLQSVNIPQNCSIIGRSAFYGCTNLQSVILPDPLKEIEERTFQECSKLHSVTFGKSLTSIGENAFQDCTSLQSVNIQKECHTINKWAFSRCSSLRSVNIQNISFVYDHAFSGCTNLHTIISLSNFLNIGDFAFSDCPNLESISSYSSSDYFSETAFFGCESLTISQKIIRSGSEYKLVKVGYKSGLMDSDGNWVISPGTYRKITPYFGRFLRIENINGYGLIDYNGREVVTPNYDELEGAGNGFFRIKKNGFWGIMNYNCKIIIDTNRGYTSIGNLIPATKRFPYTMNDYKGECDINGRQISKKRVAAPKVSVASKSTSLNRNSSTSTINSKKEYSKHASFFKVLSIEILTNDEVISKNNDSKKLPIIIIDVPSILSIYYPDNKDEFNYLLFPNSIIEEKVGDSTKKTIRSALLSYKKGNKVEKVNSDKVTIFCIENGVISEVGENATTKYKVEKINSLPE